MILRRRSPYLVYILRKFFCFWNTPYHFTFYFNSSLCRKWIRQAKIWNLIWTRKLTYWENLFVQMCDEHLFSSWASSQVKWLWLRSTGKWLLENFDTLFVLNWIMQYCLFINISLLELPNFHRESNILFDPISQGGRCNQPYHHGKFDYA